MLRVWCRQDSRRTGRASRCRFARLCSKLRVIATYSDHHEIDVTRHARFQSNREAVATVDEDGLVTVQNVAGDVAIMAAYLVKRSPIFAGRWLPIGPMPKMVLRAGFEADLPTQDDRSTGRHEAEAAAYRGGAHLRRCHVPASSLSRHHRQTAHADRSARVFSRTVRTGNKRTQLVESLLKRPEYADYWALKWSDWLRVDRQVLGHQGAYAYYKWIRDSFAANKLLDRFARELITADGLLADHPAGYFYKVAKDPGDASAMLSQALLGIRIDCAKCHHHPFDRWSQDDYYGMQAFFTPIGFKSTPRGDLLTAIKTDATTHPRTGAAIFAHPLGTPMPTANSTGDRRTVLADWLTSTSNPAFARNLANRAWAHFLGRGLIEPVDDVRSTNPPTNPELLEALAQEVSEHGFDFQHLIRTIVHSRTYQASATVNETNARDEQNYSRSLLRRLDAEVLLDAICDTTGVPEKFDGVAAGSRAVQLWDSQVSHYFLTTTGRPSRTTVCECERVATPSVAQVLHGLNSPTLEGKLSHEAGRLAALHQSHLRDDNAIIDELYLVFLSRMPSDVEREVAVKHLAAGGPAHRRLAIEDLGWSLMNSLEFVFNH